MASFTCMAVARHQVLQRHGWDLDEARSLRRTCRSGWWWGSSGTAAVDRAAGFLGFGTDQTIVVPADAQGRIEVAALESTLAEIGDGPTIVCLQAGEVNTGSSTSSVRPSTRLIATGRLGARRRCVRALGRRLAALPPPDGRESRPPTRGRPMRTRPSTCPTTAGSRSCATPRRCSAIFGPDGAYLIAGAGEPSRPDAGVLPAGPRLPGLGCAAQSRPRRRTLTWSIGLGAHAHAVRRRRSPRCPGSRWSTTSCSPR